MSPAVPIVYAVIAIALYATQAIVLEKYLAQYSVVAVVALMYMMLLVPAVGGLLLAKGGFSAIHWPKGNMLWVVALASLVFFFADVFFIGAFVEGEKRGGDYLYVIAAIGALYPVFASAVKYIWERQPPNRWHIASYLLAIAVVLLAAKGNAVLQKKKAGASDASATTAHVEKVF